jgi:hypothetical protein
LATKVDPKTLKVLAKKADNKYARRAEVKRAKKAKRKSVKGCVCVLGGLRDVFLCYSFVLE